MTFLPLDSASPDPLHEVRGHQSREAARGQRSPGGLEEAHDLTGRQAQYCVDVCVR